MKKNYTHISVILDRTGSMESIRDDTIGGFNAFLDSQQKASGVATLTLVQFDSQDPYEVIHNFKNTKKVSPLNRSTFVPRASTPLLDAIGRGIIDLEQKIAWLPDKQQPEKVVVVIITDGQENASNEFTHKQIARMVSEKQEKDRWQFVYLSADLNAFEDAGAYGFKRDSTMRYAKSSAGSGSVWNSLSMQTSAYRASRKDDFKFDEADREAQEKALGNKEETESLDIPAFLRRKKP